MVLSIESTDVYEGEAQLVLGESTLHLTKQLTKDNLTTAATRGYTCTFDIDMDDMKDMEILDIKFQLKADDGTVTTVMEIRENNIFYEAPTSVG